MNRHHAMRRQSAIRPAWLCVLLLLFASAASGQPRVGQSGYRSPPLTRRTPQQSYRSPQRFAFEVKFGPYSPNIDSTPGLTGTPFADLFSNVLGKQPPGRLLTTLEFDWQFWHGFGSLGVGASVGIMRRTAQAFIYNDGQSCTVPSCMRSGDRTALGVVPFALELVYRFDVLAQRWRIPLVPYVKGGPAYYLWWIEDGDGLAEGPPVDGKRDRAIGGTFGLVAHPGLALQLDVLDPRTAQVMDAELGINHVYVFGELNYAWINGFNSRERLVLSDISWNVGLSFEF